MSLKDLTRGQWIMHVILYLIGVGIMPLGVVLTINAHLGAGGYDALNFAFAYLLHIKTSFAIYITAGAVVVITAIIRKSVPRITTFVSSYFLGIFTDLWKMVLQPIQGSGLLSGLLLLGVGMIIIAFAVAAYMISIFPSNPTDDFVVALTEKGWKVWKAKIMLDGICVVLAIMAGGEIGVGTIICTFGLGVIVDLFHTVMIKQLQKYHCKQKVSV